MTNTDSDLIFYQPSQITAEDEYVKAKYQTPNGKEIIVRPDGRYGMYVISFTSGGLQPKEFGGMFTTVEHAEAVIKKYLETKEPVPDTAYAVANREAEKKEVTNGKSIRKQAV